ncbi:MAG TPA: uroporphyrinogen decarboxylase family protein [Planctomycetota bacterium]|nr:uroporphyrinogen decarboxylase family protein [Planctomycetota bacterium]
MTGPSREPLPTEEVIKAVERRSPKRVPMVMCRWWGEGLREEYGDRLKEFERYPEDASLAWVGSMDPASMGLSWYRPDETGRAKDAGGVISDWKHLDEFIAKMPDPEAPGRFDEAKRVAEDAHRADRYLLLGVWHFFFERPWFLRGMENLMLDYYLHPEEVHRMHEMLCDQYEGLIRRAAREIEPDGFSTSDDLGHQTQLMMKPAHFREFLKPYYARIGRVCRELGLHFWLHSCGNNTEIMEDLIETGVNVFHPVQKHTMDLASTARDFGDRMTFHVGFDVQQTLRWGSVDEVRAEVRSLVDTFDRDDGGMVLAAGNGIVGETPFENIEAFLDESLRYGTAHRKRRKSETRNPKPD